MGGWLQRRAGLLALLVTLLLGLLLFVWQLGSTGLVDETPPLFAASARAMAETGDWLIPRVNGLPRYDKPPLVYWLMGLLYRLPAQDRWNPLGTWAAGLPSALATVVLMLLLADTVRRWPPPGWAGAATGQRAAWFSGSLAAPLVAALAYALSPLVLLWGRIGVSDALFTATLASSLLLCWRTYAEPRSHWWTPWPVLALAVLTKGPVALVLVLLTLLAFTWLQSDAATLRRRLRPAAGFALAGLLALPWYALALLRDGRPFWDSFFGYHNLQRFTAVVNHHLQPWWFFGPILIVASLPATPLLLLALQRALGPRPLRPRPLPAPASLNRFAACWLLAVFAFFSLAATKLPSYWLPATPAAALLILLVGAEAAPAAPEQPTAAFLRDHPASLDPSPATVSSVDSGSGGMGVPGASLPRSSVAASPDRQLELAWTLTLALSTLLGLVCLAGPLWIGLIQDPELPTLPAAILASGRLPFAGGCYLLAAAMGCCCRRRPWPLRLLLLQLPLVAFVPLALLPLWTLGDQLRGAPVRAMASAVRQQALPGEPLAMVGILKPSLHYYSQQVVLYEGTPEEGPLNLAERLRLERRAGLQPSTTERQPTVLVVIDRNTASQPVWQGLAVTELARSGPYRLWRLERRSLEVRAQALVRRGLRSTWWRPRPERY